MRIIGQLESEMLAGRFSRYLRSQDISNEIEESSGAWDVWIVSEDDLLRGGELLRSFTQNPHDPRFLQPPPLPTAEPGRVKPPVHEAESDVRRPADDGDADATPFPRHAGVLTLGLVGLCVLVHVLKVSGYEAQLTQRFFITVVDSTGNIIQLTPGLPEVRAGEVWRLLTPAFLHGDWVHLLVNLFCLLDLGSLVERRRGWKMLALLVLVTAVISNYGQYVLFGPAFGGMSGVLYGLLGYVWMKGKFDPASGLQLPPQAVMMMLVWFVLCLVNIIPNVANGAHAVGLAVGTAWGFLASRAALRRGRPSD